MFSSRHVRSASRDPAGGFAPAKEASGMNRGSNRAEGGPGWDGEAGAADDLREFLRYGGTTVFGRMTASRAMTTRVSGFLARRKRWFVLSGALALLSVIGFLDYVTGVEMSLAPFYWVPVAIVTWYEGTAAGYAFAVASVALSVGTDISEGLTHTRSFFLFWDVAVRFLSLAIFVWMLSRIKQLYEQARKTTQLEIKLESSRAAYRELKDLS